MYTSNDDESLPLLRSNMFSLSGGRFLGAVSRSINLGGQTALALRLLLAVFSSKISSDSNRPFGDEFRAARKASEEVGAQIVLGDRPIEITLGRAWSSLNWSEKLGLVTSLLRGITSPSLGLSGSDLKDQETDVSPFQLYEQLSFSYPSLLQPLIHERDTHYVVNSSINEQLASVARVEDGDCVLEIGPGTGALTQVLLDAGATVLAVEKDPHMVIHVRDRFEGIERLTVLEEDFTKCHIHSHLSPILESGKSVRNDAKYAKVVSNIPFNISTDVVKQLLPLGDIFSEVVLLLQDETAVRLVDASLRTSEYRLINIFVNFYSDPEYKFKVPRTDFFPQPNVDAAVVTFKLKRPAEYPSVSSTKNFFSMVNSAFNGKRKMLRRSLQHIITPFEIERALENAGLPVTSRPEELTLDDFVRLHNLIANV